MSNCTCSKRGAMLSKQLKEKQYLGKLIYSEDPADSS